MQPYFIFDFGDIDFCLYRHIVKFAEAKIIKYLNLQNISTTTKRSKQNYIYGI